jgi:hypothetical protein
MRVNDLKQKIIQKTKRANFRQKIEKMIDTSTSLWRLTKWMKNKSHLSREVLKMLILKHNDQIIESFDEKIDMFKNVFFSALFFVDLNDISKSFYLNSIECSSCIIENEILTIIKWFAFNKISSLDEFTNKLLKACVSIMIKLLISFFETCI